MSSITDRMLGELAYDLKGGEGAWRPVLFDGLTGRGKAGADVGGAMATGSGTYLPLAIEAVSNASGDCDLGKK
jgi:hypothetical protein